MFDIICDIVSTLLAKEKCVGELRVEWEFQTSDGKKRYSITSQDVLGGSKPQKHEIARKRSLLLRHCLSKFQLWRWYIFVARDTRLSRTYVLPISTLQGCWSEQFLRQ